MLGWVWYGSHEIKCFGTAQRAVPHAEEHGNEGAPSFGFLCWVEFGYCSPFWRREIKGIVQPFELGSKTRLIRSAVK